MVLSENLVSILTINVYYVLLVKFATFLHQFCEHGWIYIVIFGEDFVNELRIHNFPDKLRIGILVFLENLGEVLVVDVFLACKLEDFLDVSWGHLIECSLQQVKTSVPTLFDNLSNKFRIYNWTSQQSTH